MSTAANVAPELPGLLAALAVALKTTLEARERAKQACEAAVSSSDQAVTDSAVLDKAAVSAVRRAIVRHEATSAAK
jgi:hypothetical protein